MMDLDSAIQHCEEVAKEKESQGYCDRSLCVIMDVNNATCDECEAVKCRECASEHRQLAEWLKELKAYRENTCGDAISRQSAIFLAGDLKQDLPDDERIADMVMAHNEGVLEYQTQLSLLPSVTPQQRTGRWIQKEEEGEAEPFVIWECSECHCVDEDGKPSYKYCPQCGAKMEVKE